MAAKLVDKNGALLQSNRIEMSMIPAGLCEALLVSRLSVLPPYPQYQS